MSSAKAASRGTCPDCTSVSGSMLQPFAMSGDEAALPPKKKPLKGAARGFPFNTNITDVACLPVKKAPPARAVLNFRQTSLIMSVPRVKESNVHGVSIFANVASSFLSCQ